MRYAKNSNIYEGIGPEDSNYSCFSRTLLGTDQPFSFYYVSTKSRTTLTEFDRTTKSGTRDYMVDDYVITQRNFVNLKENQRKFDIITEEKLAIKDRIKVT